MTPYEAKEYGIVDKVLNEYETTKPISNFYPVYLGKISFINWQEIPFIN